jgi:hypothetical protein
LYLSKNPFFKKLNISILKNLEEENGYFGNILKGGQSREFLSGRGDGRKYVSQNYYGKYSRNQGHI